MVDKIEIFDEPGMAALFQAKRPSKHEVFMQNLVNNRLVVLIPDFVIEAPYLSFRCFPGMTQDRYRLMP